VGGGGWGGGGGGGGGGGLGGGGGGGVGAEVGGFYRAPFPLLPLLLPVTCAARTTERDS